MQASPRRLVDLRGPGPFELPRMRSVVGIDGGTWETPLLRLETMQGEEVCIPISANAMVTLAELAQTWCLLPQNPLNPREP
jgi:hypothetical protein